MITFWLFVAAIAYYTGLDEADEISDGTLVSAANILLNQPRILEKSTLSAKHTSNDFNEYAPELHVLVWQDDRLVWDSHGSLGQLPHRLQLGHQTLKLNLGGQVQDWRVYVSQAPDSQGGLRRVAVFLDPSRRLAFAADVTEDIVIPTLMSLPLMALVLAWAIRRGLRPLKDMTAQILTLKIDTGQTLQSEQPYAELGVAANSINNLVQRLQGQIARERSFTADVAHELRTPLTSMVLQARRARDPVDQAEQAAALQAVENSALRAGRILSQLLDLVRAQADSGNLPESVDLCDVARRVVAEHAPLAHDLGQSMELVAPERAIVIRGSTILIELALRNLVDNALRHNARGSNVQININEETGNYISMAVSDDGAGAELTGYAAASQVKSAHHASMGIGLTLVERIAQSQGAQLVRDSGAMPFRKRYRLVWSQASH